MGDHRNVHDCAGLVQAITNSRRVSNDAVKDGVNSASASNWSRSAPSAYISPCSREGSRAHENEREIAATYELVRAGS